MKKTAVIIGLTFLIVTGYFLFSRQESDEPSTRLMTERYVSAEGKVEAMPGLDVEVGSELTGRIEKLFVKEGDRVKKGQVLARLANRDIQAKLKEAESELAVAEARLKEVASGSREEEIEKAAAALEAAVAERDLARKNLERYKDLYQEGMVSKSRLDEAERAFAVATAGVKEAEEAKRLLVAGPKPETVKLHENAVTQAEATVAYYKSLLEKILITAPISGKVIHLYLEEGEMVYSEIPMVAIADVEKIRINAEVDETDIGRIRIGDPAEITSVAYPGKVFQGRIQEISDYVGTRKVKPNNPAVNLGMKVVQVKIELLEKTPFKLGMTVDVIIKPMAK
jgi:ABC exporter DevB family membrane fusion protein